MSIPPDNDALNILFNEARTHNHWQNKPVSESTLYQLYTLISKGPTSANCSPGRFLFITSQTGKMKLRPALSLVNQEKTMAAPVTIIAAWDNHFYHYLPDLFPGAQDNHAFISNPLLTYETAMRNATLQAAYIIIAARALGLDVGPMSGFDAQKINEAFFSGYNWKVNFLINLGYGDKTKLAPRLPRLPFNTACKIL